MKHINLDHIKIAIFDFDDTLAIHKDKDFVKHRNESEEKRLGYYINAYNNPDTFYEEIEPCVRSEKLYNLIHNLRNKNVKIYCLSGMKYSFHLKAKQSFIHKYYGTDIEVLSAASKELKIDGVKMIQRIHNCRMDEILFVDDIEENIRKLKAIGVYSLLPEQIQ